MMGMMTWIKEKFKMFFKTDVEKAFGVETYLSPEMEKAIKLWGQLEKGKPPWLKESDGRTVSFSNTIAEEWAKLVTQNIDIKVEAIRGGTLSQLMQTVMDKYFLQNAKDYIHSMISLGGIMAKWDGKGIEFLRPDMFFVTEFDSNGDILAAIFLSFYSQGVKFYTKAEYHRFEIEKLNNSESKEQQTAKIYHVSTKVFVSENQDEIGREIQISQTRWADIQPEFWIENLKAPLFRYIKCPVFNNIDADSPLGVPCFANCIEELRWLDIAMSTMGIETENSVPMMMVDQSVIQYANMNNMELPKFITNTGLDFSDGSKPVEQWQPTMQVTTRIEGINFLLSVIGFKCGFDPGYFVFDGQTIQVATATQVLSTKKRTADTALSYRGVLDKPSSNGDGRVGAIHDIACIINAMLVINGKVSLSEYGDYKLFCSFADLIANEEEDKLFDYQLAQNGYMSKARFLVRHLGLTEKEALKMVREATEEKEAIQSKAGGLFADV